MTGDENELAVRQQMAHVATTVATGGQDLDRIRGIRTRQQRRRRLVGAAAIVAIAAVAGMQLRGDPGEVTRVAGQTCGAVNEGVPTFDGFSDQAPSGAIGESITVRGEGFYAPATRVAVQWGRSLDSAFAEPHGDIAQAGLTSDCTFALTFEVPDVPPGRYDLIVRIFDPESDFAIASPATFLVTAR